MIAILGAGALGRLWAASLPSGEVAFVPRPDTSSHGTVDFRFQNLTGTFHDLSVPWLATDHRTELLLVTTKAGDTLSALSPVMGTFPSDLPVVLFQNGLGSQQAVAERWPDRPVLAASTTEGANRPEPSQLVHAGSGQTWIGAMNEAAQDDVATAVERLAISGLRVHPEADITGRLWQKLVINAGINPFTAILNCVNGDILATGLYRENIPGLCGEMAQLLEATGQQARPARVLREEIETVVRNTARNTSSMRSDVLAGRQTEIDFINGYLVRLGNSLGIPTPVNQMLTERVKELSPH